MNCSYCKKYFRTKDAAIEHMNKCHASRLEQDGMDAAQSLYFSTHGCLTGKCMCGCGRDTDWNYKTGKPYKVSNDPSCRQRLRAKALNNHMNTYGVPTLLNDMEHQKAMEKNRPTAGEYQFADGGRVGYLSRPEMALLKFLDTIMELTSNMVQESPEYFTYYDPKADRERTYIPDYYLPDYNLLIEVKDGGAHTNTNPAFIKETKYKVALKDEVMRKQTKYNFIKVVDNNFGPLVELMYRITHEAPVDEVKKTKKTLVVITENACTDIDEQMNFTEVTENFTSCYLVVGRKPNMSTPMLVGISESPECNKIYLSDFIDGRICEVRHNDKIFTGMIIDVYWYADLQNWPNMNAYMKMIMQLALSDDNSTVWDMMELLADEGIYYSDHLGFSNNDKQRMDFVHVARYEGGDPK